MKRVVLAIRNRLVLEAVTNALKRAGVFVEKSSSQETERILTLTNALAATTLVMDVTRSGDGMFDMRMDTVKEIRRRRSTRSFMNPSRPTILPTRWTHCKNLKKERKQ